MSITAAQAMMGWGVCKRVYGWWQKRKARKEAKRAVKAVRGD